MYAREDRRSRPHTDNQSVRPKIRQQLQVLRDRDVVAFFGGGRYRVLLMPQTR